MYLLMFQQLRAIAVSKIWGIAVCKRWNLLVLWGIQNFTSEKNCVKEYYIRFTTHNRPFAKDGILLTQGSVVDSGGGLGMPGWLEDLDPTAEGYNSHSLGDSAKKIDGHFWTFAKIFYKN